jgi:hypothetical protein
MNTNLAPADDFVVAWRFASQLRLLGITMSPAPAGGLTFEPDLTPPGSEAARAWLIEHAGLILAAQDNIAEAVANTTASAEKLNQALRVLRMPDLSLENYQGVAALAYELADTIGWPLALSVAAVATVPTPPAPELPDTPLYVGQYL